MSNAKFKISCVLALFVVLLGFSGLVKAKLPVGRAVPPVSGSAQQAARFEALPSPAKSLAKIQGKAGDRPPGSPMVTVRPGQRMVSIESRQNVFALIRQIRQREGASRSKVMQILTRENGARPDAATMTSNMVKPGRVTLESNIVRVEMPNKVIHELRFVVNDGTPSIAQVEKALASLPRAMAREARPPSSLVYQQGEFWVTTEGSRVMVLLQPISKGRSALLPLYIASN